MILKYEATDVLTGVTLMRGQEVVGLKIDGLWDFTAEPISRGELCRLLDVIGLSVDGEECDLDHEDFRLLAEYGRRYEKVRAMIGCDVPGLDEEVGDVLEE